MDTREIPVEKVPKTSRFFGRMETSKAWNESETQEYKGGKIR